MIKILFQSNGLGLLNLIEIGRLDFEEPDYQRFPCLALAMQAWMQRYDLGDGLRFTKPPKLGQHAGQ